MSELSDMLKKWREQVYDANAPDSTNYVQTLRSITYSPRFKHLRPPFTRWLWFNKIFYKVVEDRKFDNVYPASVTTTNVDPDSDPVEITLDFSNKEGGGSSDA